MIETFVFAAGATQLGIALASLALPRILGWREQTARLEPLTRHVFWTYAVYIFCTNMFFAGVSMLRPELLTDGTPLARTFCGFVTAYWGGRVAIQLFAYRQARPKGWFFALADIGFLLAFVFLTAVYATAMLVEL
ncbi:MAG: hypothetical protein ACE37K_21940 [Planctomycetota bacterium]